MSVLQSENVSDIVTRAFAWAEHKARFKTLEDGSADALLARQMYDARRRNVLEAMDWNFARHRFAPGLSTSAVAPHDLPYAYTRPPRCIRVRNVQAAGHDLKWRAEAHVFADCGDNAQIIYTHDETNAALFAPSFVLCLEYLLAAQFAMVHARSVNRSNAMLDNFRRSMIEADQMEGAERSNDDAYERSDLDLALSSSFWNPV